MPEEKIRKIMKIAKEPISMETPIGDDDDSISATSSRTRPPGPGRCRHVSLRGVTKKCSIRPDRAKEAKVLRMRFGIEMNTDHTLEEVGKQFDVTRERIRQIEAKACNYRGLPVPEETRPTAYRPDRGGKPAFPWMMRTSFPNCRRRAIFPVAA